MNFIVIFTFFLFLFYQINIVSPGRIGSKRNKIDLGVNNHIITKSSNKKNAVSYKNTLKSKKKEYIQVIEDIEEEYDCFKERILFHDKKENYRINRHKVITKLNRDECVLVCKQKNKKNIIFSKNAYANPNKLSKNILKKTKKKFTNKNSIHKMSDEIKDGKYKTKADIEVENAFEIIKKLNITAILDENQNYKVSEKNCHQPANRVICKILAHRAANSAVIENRELFHCCCDLASEKPETEFCQNYQHCVSERKCHRNSKFKNVAKEFFKKLKEE